MNLFELLFMIGVARDLADKDYAAKVHMTHREELAVHPWRSEIENLGTAIFTEELESSFGELYAWFFQCVRDTNPWGTTMTYLLRYAPREDSLGELPPELRRQMEKILDLFSVCDPRVIAEIGTAIRMIALRTL